MKTTLKIDGMHCGACALNVDDALEEIDGVRRSKTSYARGRVKVDHDEARVSPEDLRRAVAGLGYEGRPV